MPTTVPANGKGTGLAKKIKEYLNDNRSMILVCLIATFAWGLVAHAYMFLHSSFSHDSMYEVIGIDNWKLQLGRILVPVYRQIARESTTLPWLTGILSLLFIGIAVFLIIKLFNVNSKILVVLIAGVLTANLTVTATAATFIHDLDCNMLALAFSVCAVYLWNRFRKGFLWGIIFVAAALSLYQSYITVSITLILLCLIFELLNSMPFRKALISALKGIGMLIGGGILYFLAVIVVCSATGVELVSDTANSLTGMFSLSMWEILRNLLYGYIETIKKMISYPSLSSSTVMLILNIVTIGIALIILLIGLVQKSVHWKEKISIIILALLLPIGMNVTYVLTNGYSSDLMCYAVWFIYLLVLILAWWQVDAFQWLRPFMGRTLQIVMGGLICVVLLFNVQTSNAVYLQKDLEEQATLSLFTRIIGRMEEYDGYVPGETPVVFVGDVNTQLEMIPGLESVYDITGAGYTTSLGVGETNAYYQHYFDYILLNPAVMADSQTWTEMQKNEQAKNLSCFPEEDSIEMIDGILVVKVGP